MVKRKAAESHQVQHARQELKKQISKEHKLFTHKALQETSLRILNWLSRHQGERAKISLKGKEISLFDENRHSEKPTNAFILHLQQKLKKSLSPKSVKGRVTSKKGY